MNAARNIFEDQKEETHVEARIARLEADVEHIKHTVHSMEGHLKAANDSIATLREDVSAIKATLPHLATKEDLRGVEGSMNARVNSVEGALTARINSVEGELTARINSVEGALTAKINSVEGSLNERITALEARIIRWMVGTTLTSVSLAFAIARFVQ